MSSENRTSVPNSLNEHWMPFTSNKDFGEATDRIAKIRNKVDLLQARVKELELTV